MKFSKSTMLAGGISIFIAGNAFAADLPTKKTPPVEKPNCFATFMTWLDFYRRRLPAQLRSGYAVWPDRRWRRLSDQRRAVQQIL